MVLLFIFIVVISIIFSFSKYPKSWRNKGAIGESVVRGILGRLRDGGSFTHFLTAFTILYQNGAPSKTLALKISTESPSALKISAYSFT